MIDAFAMLVLSTISLICCVLILINEWSRGFRDSRPRIKYSIVLWHVVTVIHILERDYLLAALFAICAMLSVNKLRQYDNRKDNPNSSN